MSDKEAEQPDTSETDVAAQEKHVHSRHDHAKHGGRLPPGNSSGDDAGPESRLPAGRNGSQEPEAPGINEDPLPLDYSGVEADEDRLTAEIRKELQLQVTAGWSAPLPQPRVLAEFEKVLPGAAERIMRAFESSTTDAAARDDKIVESRTWVAKTGAGWAFFFLLVMIAAAIVFFARGNNQAGMTMIGTPNHRQPRFDHHVRN